MIEPIKQFGICWHCDNLMISSTIKQYEGGIHHLEWRASCTAKNFLNVASYPSFFDEYCQSEFWDNHAHGGEDFVFRVATCSKYEVLK